MRGEEHGTTWHNQSRLGSNLAVLGLKHELPTKLGPTEAQHGEHVQTDATSEDAPMRRLPRIEDVL